MHKSVIHNFSWIPLVFFGIGIVFLGLRWLVHPEPWLIDKISNEDLIQKSFDELFKSEINYYLPDYLAVIYLFLGWCVIALGMLIIIYIHITKMGTNKYRNANGDIDGLK